MAKKTIRHRTPGARQFSSSPASSLRPGPAASTVLSIVGIGASAGGLEAFTTLLKALPTDTGLALVLVQHLDPAHESALTVMDGEQIARAIKTDPAISATELILISSGSHHRSDTARFKEAGFAACLLKPLGRPSILRTAMTSAWENQQSRHRSSPSPRLGENISTASQTNPTPASGQDRTPQRLSERRVRVLLVEDNRANQRLAQMLLQKMGCMVDTVSDGREAVRMAEAFHYDVIFMDCQMPYMDGFEATAAIRLKERGSRHTPIIALTAHAMVGDRAKCLAAGMDDYVSKPINPGELSRVHLQWIKVSQQASAPHTNSTTTPSRDY